MQNNRIPANIHDLIFRWYRSQGRSLPWRDIRSAYRVLVSEVMLQQTQVPRVVDAYPRFLRRFPTLRSLAAAPQRDVILAWQGMGYNNRAVHLHRLARVVAERHGGRLPREAGTLLALPGIGRYTASAMMAFAFREPVPVVDVNVRRFLSRRFWKVPSASRLRDEEEVWRMAARILPSHRTYDWSQALMDLGASVCTARRPLCSRCPVRRGCPSRPFMHRTGRTMRRIEPSFKGVPNRIYRGRIVQELRMNGGRRILTIDAIGRKIAGRYAHADRAWVVFLVRGLEKDGIVTVRGNGSHQKVSLA